MRMKSLENLLIKLQIKIFFLSLGDTNNFESEISIINSNRYSLNDESDL